MLGCEHQHRSLAEEGIVTTLADLDTLEALLWTAAGKAYRYRLMQES